MHKELNALRDNVNIINRENVILKEEVRVKSETISLLRESSKDVQNEVDKDDDIKCTYCTFQTDDQSILDEHQAVHDIYHICSLGCEEAFASKKELDIHMTSKHKHNSGNTFFQCSNCDSKFKTDNFLKLHFEKMHKQTQQAGCNSCGEVFNSQKELRIH